MNKQTGRGAGGFSLALFALLLACLLALVLLGGGVYGAVAAGQRANNGARAALGYLATQVRAADQAGAVGLAQGPEGQALVLAQPQVGYETRIYLSGGWLVEEYCPAGAPFDPGRGTQVAQSGTLQLEFTRPGLLRIQTDAGTAQVALRSEGGDGA